MNKRRASLGIMLVGALFVVLPGGRATGNTAATPEARDGRFHQSYVERARQGGIDLLFIGDSITQYWTDRSPARGGLPVWQREFEPLRAANFGVNGERTQHILWRLQNGEGEGYRPKAVVLLAGTNNTGREKGGSGLRNTAPEIVDGIVAIVTELRGRFPEARILLLGLLPRWPAGSDYRKQIEEVNRRLPAIGGDGQVVYIDCGAPFLLPDGEVDRRLMPDGIHPNAAGYEILTAAIKAALGDTLKLEESNI